MYSYSTMTPVLPFPTSGSATPIESGQVRQ